METAVVVLVPEAEGLVGPWRLKHDPSAAEGVPAHVTLLYPFVPFERINDTVEAGIARVFAGASPFGLGFSHTRRFPGVLWLAPDDPAPLIALTQALMAMFPEYPPYGGAHETVTHHLTVAQIRDGEVATVLDRIEAKFIAEANSSLPIRARAEEAWLLTEEEGGMWRSVRPYRFGANG
jgi:hypothetical protein